MRLDSALGRARIVSWTRGGQYRRKIRQISRADLIQANLGDSVGVIKTLGDRTGSGYTINRRYRQAPSLTTLDGKPVPAVDLDRGTFLPLDAYSSQEIESIADESFGERRRSLIDELQGPDYRALVHALGVKRRDLEANADTIKLANQKLADLTERIEELGDVRARVQALPAPPMGADSKLLDDALRQQHANTAEAQFVRGAITSLNDLGRALQLGIDVRAPQAPDGKSRNSKIVATVDEALRDGFELARSGVADIRKKLGEVVAAVKRLEAELVKAQSEQEKILLARAGLLGNQKRAVTTSN